MPEYLDILNETYNSNCRRIAELCAERALVVAQYEQDFRVCRGLDHLLTLSLQFSERTTQLDAEIDALARGSKKLLALIDVYGIAAAPEPRSEWWSESGLL